MIIVKVEHNRNDKKEKYFIWDEKKRDFFRTNNIKEILWKIEKEILKAEKKLKRLGL